MVLKKQQTNKFPNDVASKKQVGYFKQGNDGNLWIIAKNENKIKVWQKMDYEFVSTDITVIRNNSELLPLPEKTHKLTITSDEKIKLELSSTHVKEVDEFTICSTLQQLSTFQVDKYSSWKGQPITFSFIYHNHPYTVTINHTTKYKRVEIAYLMKLLQLYENDICFLQDSRAVVKEHHYGTLVEFTGDIIKKLVPHEKYYIVMGQWWHSDYTGEHSIRVLQYAPEKTVTSHDRYDICGLMIKDRNNSKYQDHVTYDPASDSGMLNGGDDPVYFVYEWRSGFQLSEDFPEAKTIKDVGITVDLDVSLDLDQ